MKLKFLVLFLLFGALSACSQQAPQTALPTVELNAPSATSVPFLSVGGVAASGSVVAEHEAQMAFTIGGSLKVINVMEGEIVQAGQVLAELENAVYIRELAQSKRNLSVLTSFASQAAAAQALAIARQTLKDEQDKVNAQFYRRASDTLIDKTQGEIDLAKQALARAADAYRLVAKLEDGDNRKAAALVAMTNAQLRLNDLIAKYNWYSGKPSEIDVALANSKLDVAKAAVQEAEWYLAALKGESIPEDATGSNLYRLEAAKTAINTAQERLDQTRLVSPISGVIIKVNNSAGEMVAPGQIIFFISDVDPLLVETTDLSERDVPIVEVGQKVVISIKALNTSVTGHVISISPVADILGGDVVYKTKVQFDTPPEGLRAGMSVDVQYETVR
jgi:multidrug efflux pump subunit AcrA (membrane-fusion protein)